jgi:Flp pilus assembly protein TadD
MRFRTVLFLALSFGALGGEAAAEWTRLQTTNFTFVGDAPERDIRRVARQLEQFREVTVRALSQTDAAPAAAIVVIVFANDRSFRPFKPRFQGRVIEVAGYLRGGQDVNFIAINGDLEYAIRTVFHEYSHFLVSSTLRVTPIWVNEGLAGLYETFEERDGGKRAVLGLSPPEYIQELRSRTLIPLSELTGADRSSPMYNEGNRRGLLYAQSWALMHYLMFGSEARYAQLTRYLTHMRNGISPEDAFTKEFGAELPAIEKELREYVMRRTLPAETYTFETTTRAALEAKSEKVSDDEAAGYLGDLLARGESTEAARAYLKKVIASNADAARALYALGLLELRESHDEEAVRLLERATKLRPDEAVFLAAYGRALVESLRNADSRDAGWQSIADRARAVLSRSVELDQNAAVAVAFLGYLELLDGESARAVELFKRAVASAPSDESYQLLLADALMRQGDFIQATAAFSFLLAYGSSQDVRERARDGLGRVATRRLQAAARAKAGAVEPTVAPADTAVAPPTDRGRRASPQIRLDLRKLGTGEQRVLGVFRGIQCVQGAVVLEVQTPSALLRFAARQFSDIDFISYRTDTPSGVKCGNVPGTPPILATYRPAASGPSADGIAGAAVAIELVPDGYVPP